MALPDPANLAAAYRTALTNLIAETRLDYPHTPELSTALRAANRAGAWRRVQEEIAWSIAYDFAHGRTTDPGNGPAWLACQRRAGVITELMGRRVVAAAEQRIAATR